MEAQSLTWDDTYSIVQLLRKHHPDVRIEEASLLSIFRWTVNLPEFGDDPSLANDAILTDIYQEWFEEENPI